MFIYSKSENNNLEYFSNTLLVGHDVLNLYESMRLSSLKKYNHVLLLLYAL